MFFERLERVALVQSPRAQRLGAWSAIAAAALLTALSQPAQADVTAARAVGLADAGVAAAALVTCDPKHKLNCGQCGSLACDGDGWVCNPVDDGTACTGGACTGGTCGPVHVTCPPATAATTWQVSGASCVAVCNPGFSGSPCESATVAPQATQCTVDGTGSCSVTLNVVSSGDAPTLQIWRSAALPVANGPAVTLVACTSGQLSGTRSVLLFARHP